MRIGEEVLGMGVYDQIWVKELLDVVKFAAEMNTSDADAMKIDVIAFCMDKIKAGVG